MPEATPPAAGRCGVFADELDQHRAVCLAYARRILRDSHLAEDAVQEALLDAWRLRGDFDAGRGPLQGWLLMLTHRRSVDWVRREQRRRQFLGQLHGLAPLPQDGPEDLAWRACQASAVRGALAQLGRQHREVLVLAYFGGHTQTEIAALTGLPLGTVKTRTAAAQRRLRACLQYCAGDLASL